MPLQTITRACRRCGAPFIPAAYLLKPHVIAKGHGGYCGRDCRYADARRIPLVDRFWIKVTKTETCWPWVGATVSGYGTIGSGGKHGRVLKAHRVAWEIASGEPIPDGLWVIHTCDNPPCVRNDTFGTYEVNRKLLPRWGHLALGTEEDNAVDKMIKDRGVFHSGDSHYSRQRPEVLARGERNGFAKLTDAAVIGIRSRWHAGGVLQTQLAAEHGVSKTVISKILLGKAWKHLPLNP